MNIKILQIVLISSLIVSVPHIGAAQPSDSTKERKWYVPSHLALNYAGHQGLFAFGPGLTFGKNKMYLELTFGWLPEYIGGADIKSLHLKYTYKPLKMVFVNPERLEFSPIDLIFFLNRTRLNSESRLNKSIYPSNYYWWMNNTRMELGIGQSWNYYFKEGNSQALQLYYEFITNDLYIHTFKENNRVKVKDIFVFGLGARYFF